MSAKPEAKYVPRDETVSILRDALRRAIKVINVWHGPVAWETYRDHSPEMKPIMRALAIIAAPALPQEWIPVNERLPGEDLSLWLVCLRDTSVRVDMWITGGASGWSQYGDDVTHWMPLPPPPSLPTGDKT